MRIVWKIVADELCVQKNSKKFLNERCVRGGRAHQGNKAINQNVFYVINAK